MLRDCSLLSLGRVGGSQDLGYNDIGYHNREIKTPFMDSLAQQGLILENFYADREVISSPFSFPSLIS